MPLLERFRKEEHKIHCVRLNNLQKQTRGFFGEERNWLLRMPTLFPGTLFYSEKVIKFPPTLDYLKHTISNSTKRRSPENLNRLKKIRLFSEMKNYLQPTKKICFLRVRLS